VGLEAVAKENAAKIGSATILHSLMFNSGAMKETPLLVCLPTRFARRKTLFHAHMAMMRSLLVEKENERKQSNRKTQEQRKKESLVTRVKQISARTKTAKEKR
jgi:hypothetical protein